MKIQAKVMMNYYDDNSSGFAEIYNNDFDSAQNIIKKVKADGKSKQSHDDNEDEDDPNIHKQSIDGED